MIEDNEIKNNSISIWEILLIFLKNKKIILIFTGIVLVVASVLYFFVFDLIYFSTASIKSTSKSSGLMGVLDGGLPDIGSLDDFGISGGKSAKELASYEEILLSRRCLESLIVKFNLVERDDYRFLEDAIKDFRENKLVIKQEKLAGVLYIGVYDKDSQLAKEMVEYLLAQLDKINIELSVQNAKTNREFIEKRYYQAKEDLTRAEDSLKHYQSIYGIAPDIQVKAAAQSVFTMEAELKTEEVKLDVLKKILSSDQPEVKTQEAKVNSIRSKISQMQNSTDINDLLRLGNSPQIVMNYLRLVRDVEIQTKILTFILPVFEQSKIEEKRDTPTILVLDKPVVAERKTKPKRLIMIFLCTFIGFISVMIYYVGKEKFVVLYSLLKQKKLIGEQK